ncbi:MAG TPA: hypothetical protein PLS77_11780 [Anaerolineaceae bacterium]|nr:hypothetical protein [Anaerolineaceae bacterium]HOH20977.1 hypothetical protein [Anaerolineaceae bacterium]HOU44709.1 hypothetical protein [Anaerolineaceae bacterium]HQF46498.1 hypothetical protein [Anaerolineaceae bacterium]HQH36374.1 hypothetical protein [Anaerolineaceae bacterium]
MNPLIGKWTQPAGQPYPGLFFVFNEDGSFRAEFAEMGITSSGTYSVSGDILSMNQSQHTLGLVGQFEGRFAVEDDALKLALGNPGEKAPEDLSKARIYIRS